MKTLKIRNTDKIRKAIQKTKTKHIMNEKIIHILETSPAKLIELGIEIERAG